MDIRQRMQDVFGTLGRPTPETLKRALAGLGATLDELRPYLVEPAGCPYGRHLLYWSPEVEVLVMNWAPETECEPHDHANSFGCVAVITGVATHTTYHTDPQEGLVPAQATLEPVGTMLIAPVGIVHKMGNPHTAPLVTLHVYSPPIAGMHVFDLAQQLEYVVTDDCGAWIPANDAKIVQCTTLKGAHDAQAA